MFYIWLLIRQTFGISTNATKFNTMKTIKVFILLSILFTSTDSFSQFKNRHFKAIPEGFSKDYLITREIVSGRRLSYESFKNGDFVRASEEEEKNLKNTMLLGSATYLFDYLKEKYPNFSPVVVQPNGYTSTSFYINFKFDKGEIYIIRTINSNNLFLMDPFAAENPRNYSLLYAFKFENYNDQKEIKDLIKNYAYESNMTILTLSK